MKNISVLFTSTGCNAAYVEIMAKQAAANGHKEIALEKCGYTLIGTRLVPETLFAQVKAELADTMLDYGFVLGATSIFSDEFLASLEQASRVVLMSVVMALIERGDLVLNFIESEEAAA